jgi:hypothetical protein
MRKRRVGATARSRQIVGRRETACPQVVTEMAAPLELRTPTGACGEGRNQSADGSMATKARKTTGRSSVRERFTQGKRNGKQRRRDSARNARMRRCLMLRQGTSPLRPPAPFPLSAIFQKGGSLSRVRRPRKKRAPLTENLPSEDIPKIRERGLSGNVAAMLPPPDGRPPSSGVYTRAFKIVLDTGWPSHGSRDREGAEALKYAMVFLK